MKVFAVLLIVGTIGASFMAGKDYGRRGHGNVIECGWWKQSGGNEKLVTVSFTTDTSKFFDRRYDEIYEWNVERSADTRALPSEFTGEAICGQIMGWDFSIIDESK